MADLRLTQFRNNVIDIAEATGDVLVPRLATTDSELQKLTWLGAADTSEDGYVDLAEGEAYLTAHPELLDATNSTLYAHARVLRQRAQLPGQRITVEGYAGADMLTGNGLAGGIVKYATTKTNAGGSAYGVFEGGFRGSAGYRIRHEEEAPDLGSARRQAGDQTLDRGFTLSGSGYMEQSMLGTPSNPDFVRLGGYGGIYTAYAWEGTTPVYTLANPDERTAPEDSFEIGIQAGAQVKLVGRIPGVDANFYAGATVEGQLGIEALTAMPTEERMTLHGNFYLNLGAQF